ncbi:hypothetical protein [Protofrankia sp. BMG5.30]|uniref:hypothetical protein n=1 Tax=Protofrankia sp. BMG5.30 TaxID=1834514 RepID=UPI000975782C|nr:hypothetical protein [Protofrankia sp. BMG5.30]ONH32671.1 hypothetical protein BL254_21250 [Protofrankia sp. BMG5.30]
MPIIPPGFDPPRDPSDGRPFVRLDAPGHGFYEMTVRPGADPFDIARIAVAIPTDAVFVEALGDVDVVLVFRAIPGSALPATATPPPRQPGPAGGWLPDVRLYRMVPALPQPR